MAEDYLAELLRNMQSSIESVSRKQDEHNKKLEEIHFQTTETNGRVTTLEKAVEILQKIKFNSRGKNSLIPPVSDRFLTLMALAAVIIVIIVAASLKVDISRVLP